MHAAASPPGEQTPQAFDAEFSLQLEKLKELLGTYLKAEDIERVAEAFRFSAEAHKSQFRISGDPYFSHPLAVAGILTGWHLDAQALMAALLHDVTEDTEIDNRQIGERFGKVTAELVDGVSKLDKIEFQSIEDAQAENFRKMLLAMARDVRVILIKLADRLHNMRTLETLRPDKRRRIARETLEIYAPIANRLGLNNLYRELQELAFRHVWPMRYRVLAKAIKAARGNRREVVGKILGGIKARLAEAQIEAEVMGREKHLYGIYRKMRGKSLSFSQVLDIYGFRVIVRDVPTCYLALGALHSLYKPVPGKFKDYIAIPKGNGYQSLHTTLIGPYGTPVEVQIRTTEMHHVAESGVASHWLYKDDKSLSELQQRTHKWLQSLLELQSASGDSAEFLEHLKIDLFPGEVYVFSPKGRILPLPRGSTAVDFAYAVHTDIGNRCVACRINHELMPLRTELRNGDQVEIITATHANPNPAWLSYVKTGKARSQIRHFLKTMQYEESAALGERLLAQALRSFELSLGRIGDTVWEKFVAECGAKSQKEVLTDIGLGKRLPAIVARRLAEGIEKGEPAAEPKPQGPILIRGSEGMAVQLAHCCRPIPGDPIIGVIKKGQGLVVHLADCPSISVRGRGERAKWVDVEWERDSGKLFEAAIKIEAENRRGVLAKVAAEIAEAGSNIQHVTMDDEHGVYTSLYFTLQVSNRVHLARILRALRHIPEVVRISRVRE
ncbi:MAG: bifunctional (p)ppGpp synthetase/guanosine-3',5'-bis(diphosphate) 3'-pyrophosphohydrolase [Burkholderiales bacterium]|jgi:guanosine-3',5'-bis(diphosphate) 3'-pyrophosphohydrolase|uniref:Bifunctional (P)ppGpp synthetase/guanosine-3',5'-bis(Diphosphate) 3'-pyrophosphohydrolase n=1 Tax=Candidatus Desulfobacillus denitrificans TaxID=2608985 RepID=A0A809RJ16_9PROT|nr:bifunctional (p)ppGpp synthetase/guanosine-3',5'-bis(diphosphate) 3'-pyrophosphohydrolase [Zoogloeaceae bacterium]MBP9654016.1 bifunctional (p)ppGpp synthetase/guanosine-3',5'-bis(diphosphate) 3'-pyrophosphohydrolase [Rhodocyclaceae bacterium]MCZ2419660.1 bifunctional (p)ppGpp synthetase/guanosine-3',5'-bis(diphosphate) 3'-pyrophosphohydrolase [Burkholderiales bacterium]BBO19402.1 bifunctional (p)ppGpp synthetase/guanosine-3',5'-bis(diphosphate) 3'-pyrophosphohydrolase [Candidatus Desulfobaci